MPSVYTIQGARVLKKAKASPKQKKARQRMKKAAKTCKGLKGGKFKSCMKRELKK